MGPPILLCSQPASWGNKLPWNRSRKLVSFVYQCIKLQFECWFEHWASMWSRVLNVTLNLLKLSCMNLHTGAQALQILYIRYLHAFETLWHAIWFQDYINRSQVSIWRSNGLAAFALPEYLVIQSHSSFGIGPSRAQLLCLNFIWTAFLFTTLLINHFMILLFADLFRYVEIQCLTAIVSVNIQMRRSFSPLKDCKMSSYNTWSVQKYCSHRVIWSSWLHSYGKIVQTYARLAEIEISADSRSSAGASPSGFPN